MNSDRNHDRELSALISAMLDGGATAAQESRLGELLRDNPNAQEFYVDWCKTHALLRQELGGRCGFSTIAAQTSADVIGSEFDKPNLPGKIDDPESSRDDSSSLGGYAPIVIQPFPDSSSPLAFPLGGFVFSYGAAAVIVMIGILIGWAYQVSIPRPGRQEVAKVGPGLRRKVSAPRKKWSSSAA